MDDPETCGAKTRDGDPCKRPAGWGTDHTGEGKCKQHGGAGGAPEGEANGSHSHGGFAEKLDEDEIIDAFSEAADVNNLDPVWMRLAGEAFARYERSNDARHLAECRRCLKQAGDGEDGDLGVRDIEVVAEVT